MLVLVRLKVTSEGFLDMIHKYNSMFIKNYIRKLEILKK